MKKIIFSIMVIACSSCATKSSFLTATFGNKNVYKTKSALAVQKVYTADRPATDLRTFTILPNSAEKITKTVVTVALEPGSKEETPRKIVTEVQSTLPETTSVTTVTTTPLETANEKVTSVKTSLKMEPDEMEYNEFIRYKVVLQDDSDFKYIRILPGAVFKNLDEEYPQIVKDDISDTDSKPEDFIFRVAKKDLSPNTHYLASSALIGKIITLPLRVRKQTWNNNSTEIQGALSLAYGMGWKYKIGNHPYRSHYISSILYAAGISQQKYYSVITTDENFTLSEKTDEFAITYLSFGLSYEYEKFNIGLFVGKDKMFGNLNNWVYQDKWWWGVGIGYELFK